jgi:hypothetical protein
MGCTTLGHNLLLLLPLDMSGAWLKANPGVVRPEDIAPHEYMPFVDASLLGR